jgi:hypothetical protein
MSKQEINEVVDFLSQPENFMLGREVADEIFATQGFVAFLWGVDDIRCVKGGQNLTNEECFEILDIMERNHDANIGVNWDVIRYYVSDYVTEEEYKNDKRDEENENDKRHE